MQYTYQSIACLYKLGIWEVYRVDDCTSLDVSLQLVSCHYSAVVLALLGRSAQVRDSNDILNTDDLIAWEVNNVSCNLAACKSLNDSVSVYELASCKVENLYAVLAKSKCILVDGILCISVEWEVQRDVVGLCIDVVYVVCNSNLRLEVKSSINRKERVVADNVHTQRYSDVSKLSADSTKSDKTECLAHYLVACKVGFAFLDHFAYLSAIALECLSPLDSLGDLSGSKQKSAQSKLLNSVSVSARCVENNDALLSALVNRDIVCACACSCDSEEVVLELHIVHLCRTHHYSLRGVAVISYVVVVAESACADSSDLIECQYVYHFSLPLSYLLFACQTLKGLRHICSDYS